MIIVAENLNPDVHLHVESNCEESANVISTRNSLKTVDSIKPLHRQVLMILTHSRFSLGYNIKYSIKYRLSYDSNLNTWPGLEGEEITNYPIIDAKTSSLHDLRKIEKK